MLEQLQLVQRSEYDGVWYYVRLGCACLKATQDKSVAVGIYNDVLAGRTNKEEVLMQETLIVSQPNAN